MKPENRIHVPLTVRIPEDMIPAKWSDFDFWTEYGKELGASGFAQIREKDPGYPDDESICESTAVGRGRGGG